ncbi:MAG: Uma2 family endonuclease [Cyanobacteria bacterium P01_A01_bin.105]
MVQAQLKPLTFEEYLAAYPEDGGIYELINGEVVMVNPRGDHEEVIAYLVAEFNYEMRRLQLPYLLPRTCTVKPKSPYMGYKPDITVLKTDALLTEPRWQKSSTITQGTSVPLAVEVVSTNWRDDYGHKLTDYEAMGIQEYWIVDYLGLGGRRHIGRTRPPTLTLCKWVDGDYQIQQFRGRDKITSDIFPDAKLYADTIFKAGKLP